MDHVALRLVQTTPSSSPSASPEEEGNTTSWCDGIEYTSKQVDHFHNDDGLDWEWDYLTKTYDRDGFFHQDLMIPQAKSFIDEVHANASSGLSNLSNASKQVATIATSTPSSDGVPNEPSQSSNSGEQEDISSCSSSIIEVVASTSSDRLHQLYLRQQELLRGPSVQHFVSTPRILELMAEVPPSTTVTKISSEDCVTLSSAMGMSIEKPANLFASTHNIAVSSSCHAELRGKVTYSPQLKEYGPCGSMAMCRVAASDPLVPDKPINKALLPVLPPLSAYNYFYRNERDIIINGMVTANDPLPSPVWDFTPDKMASLLHQHWRVDPFKKKRRHRKTHGIVPFAKLATIISQRWKMLPEHGREFYRQVASVDLQRYRRCMAARNGQTPRGLAAAAAAAATSAAAATLVVA